MKHAESIPLVTTIRERCRVCYTCVRECPAKAIRIAEGQAEVIPERCIGCGNCVRVCSQNAKAVLNSIEDVERLIRGESRVTAILAPSFPAEFTECGHGQLLGMVRALGFDMVHEVAFGADLIARAYRRLVAETNGRRYVATSCPAVVAYVERYQPELVESLAPIVSPMVATARALHRIYGDDLKIVFVGPCVAKKGELASENVPGEVDAGLTFVELRSMFERNGIEPSGVEASEFDPPHAGTGALLSISRGLLQAADIPEDLLAGEVVAADGRTGFVEALNQFKAGDLDARLLEVLACHGCIMGPGVSNQSPLFSRRSHVSRYVRARMEGFDRGRWQASLDSLADLDLHRRFTANDQRVPVPGGEELNRILARLGKFKSEDELNCGACGYDTCREHAIAIYKGLAESEMCLPYTIEQLRTTVAELVSAREALMQSEKLASMGQLAAGIAHEVNNPLGVVLMYAHLLLEECDRDSALRGDLSMIASQADRCKKIVAGLLDFARQKEVRRKRTNVCEIVEQSLKDSRVPGRIRTGVVCDVADPHAELDADQFTQVLTNLISNAVAAMPEGGDLTLQVAGDDGRVCFIVSDTGSGIPPGNVKRIFDPFFTTKPIGKGTGLGLAVTYGIVKMHYGDIEVESNADPSTGPTGTTFTVSIPRAGRAS